MTDLLELLTGGLRGPAAAQLGRQIGTDQETAAQAAPAALAALVGALAGNAGRPGGAEALAGALARDHDGSVLSDVPGFLSGGDATAGDAILRHVLGGRRGQMESTLSRTTGLDAAAVGKLLALLAPLVLGALGKTQRQQGLDAGSLAGLLGGQRAALERQAPEGLGGLLGGFLDADRDGDVIDDVTRLGGDLLGGFLGGKR